MLKYELTRYKYGENDYRYEIIANDTVYIVYIVTGGSGFRTKILHAGESWREGSDELFGVYETQKQADIAVNTVY